MFLVGGSIIVHNIQALHHLLEPVYAVSSSIAFTSVVAPMAIEGVVGVVMGSVCLISVTSLQKLLGRKNS
jgi:uncharacterized protein